VNLLLITQKVDQTDDVLGFFHGWIERLAQHCQTLTVLCLEVGSHDLPAHVEVISLGKDPTRPRWANRVRGVLAFYRQIWSRRRRYDQVLVHMNPEYVVLGGMFWGIWRKRVFLWYTHRSVTAALRAAQFLVERIFTASPESCRLRSRRVAVTGHGIDLDLFSLRSRLRHGRFQILTAGRVAPAKNLHLLIEAAAMLRRWQFDFELRIAGGPALGSNHSYLCRLEELIAHHDLREQVTLVGALPHRSLPGFYAEGDLFVNLSSTGSVDKAVLEAMGSGLLVLTSNEAFAPLLPERYLVPNDPKRIAEKIVSLSTAAPDPSLRQLVERSHDLGALVRSMTRLMT